MPVRLRELSLCDCRGRQAPCFSLTTVIMSGYEHACDLNVCPETFRPARSQHGWTNYFMRLGSFRNYWQRVIGLLWPLLRIKSIVFSKYLMLKSILYFPTGYAKTRSRVCKLPNQKAFSELASSSNALLTRFLVCKSSVLNCFKNLDSR